MLFAGRLVVRLPAALSLFAITPVEHQRRTLSLTLITASHFFGHPTSRLRDSTLLHCSVFYKSQPEQQTRRRPRLQKQKNAGKPFYTRSVRRAPFACWSGVCKPTFRIVLNLIIKTVAVYRIRISFAFYFKLPREEDARRALSVPVKSFSRNRFVRKKSFLFSSQKFFLEWPVCLEVRHKNVRHFLRSELCHLFTSRKREFGNRSRNFGANPESILFCRSKILSLSKSLGINFFYWLFQFKTF